MSGKSEKIKLADDKRKQTWYPLKVKRTVKNAKFCKCYCANRTGCNLIQDIFSHPGILPIKKNTSLGDGSQYQFRKNYMSFNAYKRVNIDTDKGKKRAKAHLQFAHELVHALDDLNGKIPNGPTFEQRREFEERAVRGTNQIRQDQGLKYHRTTHSGITVRQPTNTEIDGNDRWNCDCP
jgi:hypothetical protein